MNNVGFTVVTPVFSAELYTDAGPDKYLSDHFSVRSSKEQSWCQEQEHPRKTDEDRGGAVSCVCCGAFQQCMETLSSHNQQNIFLRQENILILS